MAVVEGGDPGVVVVVEGKLNSAVLETLKLGSVDAMVEEPGLNCMDVVVVGAGIGCVDVVVEGVDCLCGDEEVEVRLGSVVVRKVVRLDSEGREKMEVLEFSGMA